jgi:N,N'-diacetyllegionaminate synthase
MNKRVLIIAEAGVNHNGDHRIAKELIDRAAEAGADLVKFQSFSASRLATHAAKNAAYQDLSSGACETHFEMLQRLELSEKMHRELISHCNERKIGFFSSAFDIESVDLLQSLGQRRFKIPSGEITNLPYLRHIGGLRKEVILSSGMATLGEIESAIRVLEEAGTLRDQITVLHCTSEYPTPMAEVNLRAMRTIHDAFGVAVGYSDHTAGVEVAIAAVALGANVIEKHFTLDKNLPGPDHKASLEPKELAAMITSIRNIEKALGDGVKRPTPSELLNRPVARKSLVARVRVASGEVFSADMLAAKRPGIGISPMLLDSIIGTAAKRDFLPDELIEL